MLTQIADYITTGEILDYHKKGIMLLVQKTNNMWGHLLSVDITTCTNADFLSPMLTNLDPVLI
jgi:hypothetical protein